MFLKIITGLVLLIGLFHSVFSTQAKSTVMSVNETIADMKATEPCHA